MNILKALSLSQNKIIASEPSNSQDVCWEAKFNVRQVTPLTTIVVEEGQLALILMNQNITAILENGSFPLSWIFNSAAQDFSSMKIYFLTTKTFIDQRWGTSVPVVYQDPVKGTVSLRAHGSFSYSVGNPKKLWRHIPAEATSYSIEDIIDELRSIILNEFTVTLNASNQIQKLMTQRKEFSDILMQNLSKSFTDYGLKLNAFLIQSLSLPEETANNDNFSKLEKLNELYKQGILTEEEYNAKKKLLLKDI
jgi:membrane protease subunit (stomatin/prohibitin family)